MNQLLTDQYIRVLDSLPADDPWAPLEASGFLDLLAPEAAGGAGASLEDLFPIAVETGRRSAPAGVLTVMAQRIAEPVPVALAAVLSAGEMVGALLAIEVLTLEYAGTRKQFGREIGRFQAIQQQVAVLAEEILAARAAVEAAFAGDPRQVPEARAAIAAARTARAGVRVSTIAHAVHGAIGVSEEYALHRYTRRLRELTMGCGGASAWERQLGAWVLEQDEDITSLARLLSDC
jgi:alkylation response protein AidB-like acyl-CoA dehydrogenase